MQLLNILILDDEEFIVEWISNLLEIQDDINAEIFKSYTAEQALKKITSIRIDILITDIKMPDMNGITLAKQCLLRSPMCKVLLLSAFNNFDYAQVAINSGIVGYILKNQTDSQILLEIRRAIKLVDSEILKQKNLESAQKDRDAFYNELNRNAFKRLIHGQYRNITELIGYIDTLKFDTSYNKYCILIAKTNSNISMHSPHLFHTKAMLLYNINESISHYYTEIDDNMMVWLLQPKKSTVENFTTWLLGILEVVQNIYRESYNNSISFVVSEILNNYKDIAESFFLGKKLSEQSSICEHIKKYNIYDIQKKKANIQTHDHRFDKHISSLQKAFSEYNKNELLHIMDEIITSINDDCLFENNLIIEKYYSVANLLLKYINNYSLSHKFIAEYSIRKLFRPHHFTKWTEAFEFLKQTSEFLVELLEKENNQCTCNIITIVEEYIKNNIDSDISLSKLSDQIGYNASYLSRIYSERKGITISAYIAEEKLLYVTKLFKNEAFTINEVSEKSGFNSRAYFNYFIKKHTNMNPTQYKLALSNKE